MATGDIITINTVEEFTARYGIYSTGHPLLSISRIDGANNKVPAKSTIQVNLYSVVFKQGVKGMSAYGWREYDFNKGLMNFFAPGQIVQWDEKVDLSQSKGWMLVFHPDFIRRYPLGQKIDKYKFFGYDTREALHMSDAERMVVEQVFENILREAHNNTDDQSQDIIVAQMELLLSYAQRFYKRQFRTRYSVETDIVARFQAVLQKHYERDAKKLPGAAAIALELAMSTHYLSEMLRSLTGMNTQQHIHAYIIDKAKVLLLTTQLSVTEIAFMLGFDYPQYFNRFFKNKTGHTPLEFRNMN